MAKFIVSQVAPDVHTQSPADIPILTTVSGVPRVLSTDIASRFGKRHCDVLRTIQRILTDLPTEFTERNFALSEYVDESGRKLPIYSLTRDAFSLVVMGFTGKEALAWKVRYIEAFNLMEKELAGQQALPPSPEKTPRELTPSTSADRKPIRTLLSAWAILANIEPSVLCTKVRAQFNIRRMEALPAAKVREVQDWIGKQIEDLSKDAHKAYPQIPAAFPDWRTPAINLMTKTPEHPELPIRVSDIGLDKEKCLERITHRIEEIRARTTQEVRGLYWDLVLVFDLASPMCSAELTSSVSRMLYDDIVLQITAPTPMDTPEHNPVTLVREINTLLHR